MPLPTVACQAASGGGVSRIRIRETLGWRQRLDKKLKQARALYTLILLSNGVGVGLDFAGINL
jgi:hypothetical protein